MKKSVMTLVWALCMGWALMGCKKDEENISPEEKTLTTPVWVVSEVYVNGQPAQNPPQALIGTKVKFNSSTPGTISVNNYPGSIWVVSNNNYNQITFNPATQATFTADVTKLEAGNLWLKVSKDVLFLSAQLTPNTELRMVAQ